MPVRSSIQSWWDISHEFLLEIDQQGTILAANARWQEITDWQPQDLLGHSFFDLILPHDKEKLHILWDDLLQGRLEAPSLTTSLLSQDDSRLLVHWVFQLNKDEGLVIVSGQDLTLLKVSETRLQLFSQLINTSKDMLTVQDKQGTYLYVSPSAEPITGYSASEMLGRNAELFIHPEDVALFRKMNNRVKEAPASHTITYRFVRSDGSPLWVESICQRATSSLDESDMILASIRDISERRSEEQRRDHERGLSIHASRMNSLGHMAGGLAHELNTPMTSILLSINTLLQGGNEVESNQKKRLLEIIQSKVNHIHHIVNSLQDFSSQPREEKLERHSVNVSELVERALELCAESMKSESIAIEVKHNDREAKILCHTPEIVQALMQLLQNSQYATQKQIHRWIRIESWVSASEVFLSITDSGEGIDKKLRTKILNPFFTTKPIGSGTGLGLSVAYGIIRQHGGDLSLDSSSTHTCFMIRLPRHETSTNVA